MKPTYKIVGALAVAGLSACTQVAAEQSTLPQLQLNIDQITLSGLSSGGFMANQFHVAHSDWVSGVGIIAAGPYYCAQNSILTALGSCVNKIDTPIDVAKIDQMTQQWANEGKIDATEHLNGDKVWLLSGTNDTRVIQPVVDALAEQYKSWQANVTYINDKPFAHLFPTESTGSDCAESVSPFIGNCQFDAAGQMLTTLAGSLNEKGQAKAENLFSFNQQTLGKAQAKGLGNEGYVYIPTECQQGEQCQIHVSFHGCNQYADAVGNAYATQTGLNDWAETNNLVVLYPQTVASAMAPLNPQGCWDWWGYTDENYATQEGIQIQAVTNMVNYLAGENK